jgi:hypothetical protein
MSETMAADSGTVGLEVNEIPVSDNVGGKPEPVVKSEPKVKPSTRDSVRDAIKAVEEKPQVEETAEQKAERLRNEKGQFAKADEKGDEKVEAKPEVQPEKPVKVYADPPTHWLGEEKLNWKHIPHGVRQAILNDQKALSEAQQALQSFERVLTPQRRQQLTMAYGNDLNGLDAIMQTVEFSNRDPQGFIAWFAQQRGISPPQQVQQGQSQIDPVLQPYVERVQTLEQMLQGFQQQQQQSVQQQMATEVNSFLSDHVNFPYANDVKKDMALMLQSGTASTLKDAYDKAVWANPSTRARLLAEQQQTQQAKLSQAIDQKKTAAASVTGAPGTAKPVSNGSYVKENPRDTVRRALEQAGRV